MLHQAFYFMRLPMENTVQNKKNSINALAQIIADMHALLTLFYFSHWSDLRVSRQAGAVEILGQ